MCFNTKRGRQLDELYVFSGVFPVFISCILLSCSLANKLMMMLMSVYMDVNQDDTNRNRCTQRVVIVHVRTY